MQAFLSYNPDSHQDREFVDRLSDQLKAHQVEPVSVNLKLQFGNSVRRRLLKATGSCDKVLIVCSKGYVQSKWHQIELFAFAHWQESLMREDWIVPVVIDESEPPAILDSKPCDFFNAEFAEAFRALKERLNCERRAFGVMKFGDAEVDDMCERARKVLEERNYRFTRIDKVRNSGKIPDQISNEINRSDVVLVDLTGNRPNCYYEAGYADALQKQIIFSAREGTKVHFDLASRRQIRWTGRDKDWQAFEGTLRQHLDEIETQHFMLNDEEKEAVAAAPAMPPRASRARKKVEPMPGTPKVGGLRVAGDGAADAAAAIGAGVKGVGPPPSPYRKPIAPGPDGWTPPPGERR